MSHSENREISPNTTDTENDGGFGISRLFSFLKPKFLLQQYKQQKQRRNQVPSSGGEYLLNIEADPLVNNFSSMRKRTLSLQSLQNQNNGVVPRSSTLNSNSGMYTNYSDTLKNESEVLDNDLERRLSAEYGNNIVKERALHGKRHYQDRDESPMSDLLTHRPSILPDESNANQEEMPIIIEHEFAPLYKDINGNLVRPPFINLDPRERYHVLQLKKSIQASEALQSRIKYMVNPHETQSKLLIDTNKVETSTQTHNVDYLENSLNFSGLKRRLHMKNKRNKIKRAKNTGGNFLGEFLYDDIENKNKKSGDKLHGYLGDVKKPQFNNHNDTKENGSSITIEPRKDESQIFNKFSNQNIKSTDDRIGLDDSLLKNKKIDVTLDSDYVAKSEKLASLIKVKKNNAISSKEKESVQPSSGFKFSINSNDINSIIEKKEEDEALIKKSDLILSKEVDNKKPSFSFDSSTKIKLTTAGIIDDETKKPLFSFDTLVKSKLPNSVAVLEARAAEDESSEAKLKRGRSSEKENQIKPAFSFGDLAEKKDNEAKSFPFEISKTEKNDVTKPTFSFGASAESKESDKPKFSFGVSSEQRNNDDKLALSFGSADKKNDTSKPTFTFGKSSEKKDGAIKPSFTFGKSSEKKDEAIKPSFTFETSTERKNDVSKPAFNFGSSTEKKESSKPSLTFGGISNDSTPKPSFTFGASTEKKDGEPKPAFTFGAATEKKESPKPSLTFGGPSNGGTPTSSLTFGASTEKKDGASTPAFTFGAPSSTKKDENPKPAFTFGASTSASTKPAFSFGQTSDKKETTPSFSFGTGTTGQNKDSTPKPFEKPTPAFNNTNFNFGSKDSTPKPTFSFASGTNSNNLPNNVSPANNLFNFTGTVSKEGTPDPATIFGGGTNMNTNNVNNGKNGFNKTAESSPFGLNPPKNTPEFKFANGITLFNTGLHTNDMNNQNFSPSSAMTPPTLSTTPPIIKSNRKIAQMRLRRR